MAQEKRINREFIDKVAKAQQKMRGLDLREDAPLYQRYTGYIKGLITGYAIYNEITVQFATEVLLKQVDEYINKEGK